MRKPAEPPVERPCEQCKKLFWARPNQIAKGHGRFCSLACRSYPVPVEIRFWSRVNKDGPLPKDRSLGKCWIWTGQVTGMGYGVCGVNKQRRAVFCHRLVFELSGNPPPQNVFVCHRCDTPRCVNPDHLFWGTPADNTRDMVSKGRHAYGIKSGMAKLNHNAVRQIRKDILAGALSKRAIARKFGVDGNTIYSIASGRRWAHVED